MYFVDDDSDDIFHSLIDSALEFVTLLLIMELKEPETLLS